MTSENTRVWINRVKEKKLLKTAFGRIWFTPDLLPSDETRLNFYNQKEGEFKFCKGPVHFHFRKHSLTVSS